MDDAEVVIQRVAACGYRISPLLLQQLRARHGANEPSGNAR